MNEESELRFIYDISHGDHIRQQLDQDRNRALARSSLPVVVIASYVKFEDLMLSPCHYVIPSLCAPCQGAKVEAAATKVMMWADGVGVKCVVVDGRTIKQEGIRGFKLGDI